MASERAALGPLAQDPRLAVAVTGASPERAEDAARRLAATGASVLVSWGLAGGLSPQLRSGNLIIANVVIDPAGLLHPARTPDHADRNWPTSAIFGPIAGTDELLLTTGAKRRLFDKTGALAVDMESHKVAQIAVAAGIPFCVVRAIADTAWTDLPVFSRDAISPEGNVSYRGAVRDLIKRPSQVTAAVRTAWGSARAHRTLRGIGANLVQGIIDAAR